MSTHATIMPEETADRLAIRELIDAYAHFAAWEQPELFAAELRAEFRSLR